jgi:large conductance mechanosensitive channel
MLGRGNVLDLAVAVVIGGAFGGIVNSLVQDVLMPPLGLVLANFNFADLFVSLNGETYASLKAAKDAGAPTLNYGLFFQAAINFVIVAFVIFLVVRSFTRFRKAEAPAPAPAVKECPYCISPVSVRATRCPQCASAL